MARRLTLLASAAAGTAALAAASAVQAGGCPSACPPPPCCNVPTTHQVTVPGVVVTPPSVSVMIPSIAFAGASASASASAAAFSQGAAQSSGVVYAIGGGGGFFVEQGSSGVISNLNVEAEGKPICARWEERVAPVSIQAVCVDDKAVPHPASQVSPDRELRPGYEGEVYRCIAGTRMQYTMSRSLEKAAMGGQTKVCAKGEALYHTARGELVCRPQTPARDCNERSLLRRFGAGEKVVRASERVCVEWGSEAQTASAGGLIVDGGVGGVVH